MDVAAVRPDELTPDEPAADRPVRRQRLAALAAVLLLAAAVAVLVPLLLARGDRSDRAAARAAAVQAARQEAVDLTTLSYRTASRDVDRILAGATGSLRAKFRAQRAQLPRVLRQDRSRSTGTVLAAALSRLSPDADAAEVLVATDAKVTTAAGGRASSAVKHYRMVMRLEQVHGRWLVSDVAFAGVPQ